MYVPRPVPTTGLWTTITVNRCATSVPCPGPDQAPLSYHVIVLVAHAVAQLCGGYEGLTTTGGVWGSGSHLGCSTSTLDDIAQRQSWCK